MVSPLCLAATIRMIDHPPRKEHEMNQVELKGHWNELKGKIKEKWGQITDDDLQQIEGRQDQLVGAVQKRYGKSFEQARRDVDDFLRDCGC